MCGIVGYVGSSEPSFRPQEVVMAGLARLEYRGYDSAGIAVVTKDAGAHVMYNPVYEFVK